ncbi:MAG: phosphate ABC transporter permease PtsA [Bacteroidetes bacterium]|nr:MAG: phosphate ABC transporter permease PtsA [Bacteroidota bacterium]
MNSRQKNRIKDRAFKYLGIFSTSIGLILLTVFIGSIIKDGIGRIDWDFLTNLPSRKAEKAGILTALAGSVWLLVMTAIVSIPLGVAAAIHLEEYSRKTRWSSFLEINITNLAGVPSVIYGILGLQIFVRTMRFGGSLLAGAFTLALLILPIIIVTTREAIKAVPSSIKEASYGLGATKWQTIRHQVLPAAGGSIATGIILALSRAIGETAPVIIIGALAYVAFVPQSPTDEFTVLPIQIFNWVSRPDHAFVVNAAAGIIVLLAVTFMMNGIAVYLRHRWQNKVNW